MIDIHSHILPDVDDGAKSWDIAIKMCAMAWQDGIEHMVATPHANDQYHYDRPYYEELIQKITAETGNQPALSLGCDFHLSYENIEEALGSPSKFAIGHTPYLLIEFSNYSIPPNIDESLSRLINVGLKPIITHPERNPILRQTPQRILDWIAGGCSVQVTANTLTGRWGKNSEAAARWLFEHEAVHFLATDAHSLDSRPPVLSKARDLAKELVGEEVAEMLVSGNPRAVIAGEALPYLPNGRG